MTNKKKIIAPVLIPFYGICLFILLYIVAAIYYPGGSFENASSPGFSWQHNYWCELMAKQAKNGQPNTARPIALSAMTVLVISLSVFWYYASRLFKANTPARFLVLYGGIGSMIVVIFLLTGFHDTVINIAGIAGCTAMIITLTALYRNNSRSLFYLGISCLLLCIVNNYIYYTGNFYNDLAVIQKITFLVFLLWFCLVDFLLVKKSKES